MKAKEERELLGYKFNFFVENYTDGVEEIRDKIGIKSSGTLNSFRSRNAKTQISRLYMEAIERHFDIPVSVWNSNVLDTKEIWDKQISDFRKKLKQEKKLEIFPQDPRIWEKLKGEFYAYMYGSHIFNGNREIKCIKTTFYDDFQVIDQHKNRGVVMLGDYQGIIIKKTPNEGHFSIIVFPIKQVTYGTFRFNIISIQNGTNHEMVNWGFYTKEKISIEKAEDILGQKDKVQLKLDIEFAKRIRQNFIIDYSEYD